MKTVADVPLSQKFQVHLCYLVENVDNIRAMKTVN